MKIGLLANMPVIEAQQRIERGDLNWDSPQQVYETFKSAYDDEEIAQQALLEANWRKIEQTTGRRR